MFRFREGNGRLGHPFKNKKLIPVHWPSGLKRDDWIFFFTFLKKVFFFLIVSVYPSQLKMKMKNEKKSRPTDWLFCEESGEQETIFHLRVALYKSGSIFVTSLCFD